MDWGNALADEVDANKPIGPSVTDSPSGKGRYIKVPDVPPPAKFICQLKASIVTVGGVQKVQFAWGTIVGRQPTGFSAGGVPPFRLAAATGNYYYASATANVDDLQWTASAIVIDTDPFKANTTDTAYALLTSVGTDDAGNLMISGSICGPIVFSFCDLAPPG